MSFFSWKEYGKRLEFAHFQTIRSFLSPRFSPDHWDASAKAWTHAFLYTNITSTRRCGAWSPSEARIRCTSGPIPCCFLSIALRLNSCGTKITWQNILLECNHAKSREEKKTQNNAIQTSPDHLKRASCLNCLGKVLDFILKFYVVNYWNFVWNCLGIAVELSWKSFRSSTGTYFKMSLTLFKGFIYFDLIRSVLLKLQAVLTTKLFAHESHQRKTPRFTLESWSSFWLHDRTCLPKKAAFKSPALRRCAGNNLPVHEQQTKEPNQTRFTINQIYCIIYI